MKKSIVIFCTALAAFGLTAFSFVNWNDTEQVETMRSTAVLFENGLLKNLNPQSAPDFLYSIDSRFGTTITKTDLHKATSVLDIVPKEATAWWRESFQTVTVSVLQDGDEIRVKGKHKELNPAQIKLLQSSDYSSNFYIRALGENQHPQTGEIEYYTYYLTIIPEKEAEYSEGMDALISYLKENSQAETAFLEEKKLKPGRLNFTVTKDGSVSNVKLDSSSGYSSIDERMIKLIQAMPEKWNPATNSAGEKIDQDLVFFFGQMGC